jgi:hypothetical protein
MRLTERVDDALLLVLNTLEAADPLSAITHGTDSGGPVWALESWNEKVPYYSNRNTGHQQRGKSGESECRASSTSITRKETYRACNIPIPSMATWNCAVVFDAR